MFKSSRVHPEGFRGKGSMDQGMNGSMDQGIRCSRVQGGMALYYSLIHVGWTVDVEILKGL